MLVKIQQLEKEYKRGLKNRIKHISDVSLNKKVYKTFLTKFTKDLLAINTWWDWIGVSKIRKKIQWQTRQKNETKEIKDEDKRQSKRRSKTEQHEIWKWKTNGRRHATKRQR